MFDCIIDWDVFYGFWLVECYQGNDIFEVVGFYVGNGLLYVLVFQLEYVKGFCFGKKIVGFLIVNWQCGYIDVDVVLFDQFYCCVDDCQGFKVKEVEFYKVCIFDYFYVELGDWYVGVWIVVKWNELFQWLVVNNDIGSVG